MIAFLHTLGMTWHLLGEPLHLGTKLPRTHCQARDCGDDDGDGGGVELVDVDERLDVGAD